MMVYVTCKGLPTLCACFVSPQHVEVVAQVWLVSLIGFSNGHDHKKALAAHCRYSFLYSVGILLLLLFLHIP